MATDTDYADSLSGKHPVELKGNVKGETAKVDGKEMTWDQLVKKFGSPDAAAVKAPELDPRYQKDIATEGQAKGSADYSHTVIDPMTFSNDTANPWAAGGAEAGHDINTAAQDVGSALGVWHKATPGPAAAKGKPAAKPAASSGPQPVSAAESLMNGLVNQYQQAMNTVNPYINGQVAGADVNAATNMGTEIGGPTGALTPSEQAAVGQTNSQLATDAKNYAEANQAGATGIANALTDTGKANAEYLGVAPYLGILSALTSEAQYKTETGAPPASITGSKLPPWLEQMYQGTVGSSGAVGGASAVGAGAGTAPAVVSGASPTSASTPSSDNPTFAGGGNG